MKVKYCLIALCGLIAAVYLLDSDPLLSPSEKRFAGGARTLASLSEVDLSEYGPCLKEDSAGNALLSPDYSSEECFAIGEFKSFEVGAAAGEFTHFRRRMLCDSKESITHHLILYSDSQCEKAVASGYSSAMILE